MNPDTKRLFVFGGLTGVFLIPLSVLYWITRSSIWLNILMLTPAAAVLLTRLLTKEGWKDLYIKPYWKGKTKWYLMAYLFTPVLAYAGAALYFALFPEQFSPLKSSFYLQSGAAGAQEYEEILLTTIPAAILINPLTGLVSCLGEEWAWRGYLLPKLCGNMSMTQASLLTGVIWGAWHAPVIAAGFNYGTEHPVGGILAMLVFCTVLGIIEAYLFFQTDSVWGPTLFHAAVNGIDLWTPQTLFTGGEGNPFIGPNLTGVIGGAGLLIAAVFCLMGIVRLQHKQAVKAR